MRAYAIVTGEDPEPPPPDFDHNDNYLDWKDKELRLLRRSDFPVHSRYGASLKVYEILMKCATSISNGSG